MSWIRPTMALALFGLTFPLACTDDAMDDTGAESGASPTTSNQTTNPTTSEPTSSPTTDASADDPSGNDDSTVDVGCAAGAVGETTDGATDPVMMTWGAACTSNEQCIDLIGDPAAVCDFEAVVYELPGGYCTKPCMLPDINTQAVPDAADCDPDGGVACIGSMGTFERCGIICTDDAQCNRDGYICRQLPLIAMADDPRMCLMPDCCDQLSCDE